MSTNQVGQDWLARIKRIIAHNAMVMPVEAHAACLELIADAELNVAANRDQILSMAASIATGLVSGADEAYTDCVPVQRDIAKDAVAIARAIVAEVDRVDSAGNGGTS